MTRLSLLLAGAATLIAVSAAEARDGCGRGWFFNGVACAQQEGPRGGYGYRGGGYYGGGGYFDPGSHRAPNFTGNVVRPVRGMNGDDILQQPQLHLDRRRLQAQRQQVVNCRGRLSWRPLLPDRVAVTR